VPEPDPNPRKTDPIRPTDAGARQLACTLLAEARSGALATAQADGHPFSSLTSLALDEDGTPLILISQLSAHTTHLMADPRAALLVSTTCKGDPLAHPRMTLVVHAETVTPGTQDHARCRTRFLATQPKAALYIDFGDFRLVRLRVLRASLNGGFGKAYELTAADLAGGAA
jgi:heme iron utilization protein